MSFRRNCCNSEYSAKNASKEVFDQKAIMQVVLVVVSIEIIWPFRSNKIILAVRVKTSKYCNVDKQYSLFLSWPIHHSVNDCWVVSERQTLISKCLVWPSILSTFQIIMYVSRTQFYLLFRIQNLLRLRNFYSIFLQTLFKILLVSYPLIFF